MKVLRKRLHITAFVLISSLAQVILPLVQAEPTTFSPESIQFFENKIRPLFSNNCLECHNEKKYKGNLILSSRDTILKGGDSGGAIKLSNPNGSLLIEAIKYTNSDLQMPPKKKLVSFLEASANRN